MSKKTLICLPVYLPDSEVPENADSHTFQQTPRAHLLLNNVASLAGRLDSLRDELGDVTFMVVANGCSERILNFLGDAFSQERFDNAVQLHTTAPGRTIAINAGLNAAREGNYDQYLLVDDYHFVPSQSIKGLVQLLEEHPVVGGPSIPLDLRRPKSSDVGAEPKPEFFALTNTTKARTEHFWEERQGSFGGAFHMIRRDFLDTGVQLPPVHSDDLCMKFFHMLLFDGGIPAVDQAAHVYHYPPYDREATVNIIARHLKGVEEFKAWALETPIRDIAENYLPALLKPEYASLLEAVENAEQQGDLEAKKNLIHWNKISRGVPDPDLIRERITSAADTGRSANLAYNDLLYLEGVELYHATKKTAAACLASGSCWGRTNDKKPLNMDAYPLADEQLEKRRRAQAEQPSPMVP